MKLTWDEYLQRETCGAKTRRGTACKRKDLYINGRCRLHGGLSTGPTTPEGKARVTRNLPRVKKRESQPDPEPGQGDDGQDQNP
ncbi:HGGxSTG domain-containing protein [Desulfotignum balticum]|uniref:HGGxSTG domain-containing protein n=1 Tax=Desulfotignum balticum TaxID=115781 RepID=UPI0003FE0648|nr:HGGxSTG domain-containing protein [Desulfotignum balticum]